MNIRCISISFLLILSLAACGTKKKAVTGVKPKTEVPGKPRLSEAKKLEFDNHFFNGNRHKILGNYEQALESFRAALEVDPSSDAVMFLIGQVYVELNNPAQALPWLEEAVKADPENTFYLLQLAQVQSIQKKHVESAETYRKIYKLKPRDTEAYFQAAEQLIYARKFEDAIGVYNLMEDRFGISEDIIKQKVQLYMHIGKTDKAIAEVNKLLKGNPNEPRYLGLLAELYQAAGKPDKAFEYYQKILAIEPDNGQAHFGLAAYYRLKNDSEEMFISLKKAFADPQVDVQSKFSEIFSLIPAADKDPEFKKNIYELALIICRTHPEEPNGYLLMADLYHADKQYAMAKEFYLKSLSINPSNVNAWRQVCVIDESENDLKSLVKHSEEALEYFPNQVVFYYFSAQAHHRLGEYEYAIESAKMGLGIGSIEDNINLLLYSVMGDSYHELGKHPDSDKAFDKALEINPNETYVLNNYAYYLSIRREKLEKAEQMSKLSLDLEPGNPSYLDTYGWILFQMGKYAEAKTYIEKSLQKNPQSPEVLEHMGDVLYRLGDKEKAAEYWKKAAEFGPVSDVLRKKLAGHFPNQD